MRFNYASFGSATSFYAYKKSNAQWTWTHTQYRCPFGSSPTYVPYERVPIAWAGDTTATFGQDGINAVWMTPAYQSYCGPAAACSAMWGDGTTIYEADEVYAPSGACCDGAGRSISWYDVTGSTTGSCYDFQSVATHETGHSLGLAHVFASPQTMDGNAGDICTDPFRRNLGAGDINGLYVLYPQRW
jgi:hypothetical protein